MMSELAALTLVARLSGFVAMMQSGELLSRIAWFRKGGVWDWHTLKADFITRPRWIRELLARYLGDESFKWLLWFRVVLALFVTLKPEFFGVGLLFISGWMVSMRFRGAFNGGSDSLTLLTLLGLSLGFVLPDSHLLLRLAIVFIAAQVTLSYVIAGFRKLAQPAWRQGLAVGQLLAASPFLTRDPGDETAPPASLAAPRFSRLASWITLAFECSFFLALLSPSICVMYLGAGVAFHWLNHRIFGLNRFFWAWVITYPALFATACLTR